MSAVITAEELKKKLDAGTGDFVLVDTLKPQSFEAQHVPGAINVPEEPGFAEKFEAVAHVPKDREIIVYCSSETCGAHTRAAGALKQAGYTNVVRFSGGLAGWQAAGLAFQSTN